MKREDLKLSFDRIGPDGPAKERMLKNILDRYDERGVIMPMIKFKRTLPALAIAAAVLFTLLVYNGPGSNKPGYIRPGDIASDSTGREDAAAPVLNQFQIDDRNYIVLSDDLRTSYGFPDAVGESDVGDRIATVQKGPDKSLIGCNVYRYIPAGSEAVVAVKKDNTFMLFKFFAFESYLNNQDEDAAAYLKTYGIKNAGDIAKVSFIGHSEKSKLEGRTDIRGEITDRDEIARFYNYYSVLKNASDKYFDKLFSGIGTDGGKAGAKADSGKTSGEYKDAPDSVVAPDDAAPDENGFSETSPPELQDPDESAAYANDTPAKAVTSAVPPEAQPAVPPQGTTDKGDTGGGSTEPSQGAVGDKLSNSVTIRIYNQSGVYYDSEYYLNIGFISRYEVGNEFAAFMESYIR